MTRADYFDKILVTRPDLAERDCRLSEIRKAMEQVGLTALLVAGRDTSGDVGRGYFRYLTDYHLWGHEGLVFIPLDSEPCASVTSVGVAQEIIVRGWLTDVHVDPYLVAWMATELKARGFARSRIGIAGWGAILPVGMLERLKNSLPEATLVNADGLLNRVRMVKSALEVQQNQELWTVAKAAMERFVAALEPGRTQIELAAEATNVLQRGGCRDILIWFDGHLPPENIPIIWNDVMEYHMEISGASGHWCELTVTCAFTDPSPDELRFMDSERKAYDQIRRVARPGVCLADLARTFEQVLFDDGWQLAERQILHHDFHGQGLDPVEWPLYGPLAQMDTALEKGMILSYHPHREVVPPVRATGICDDILITENGAERLSGDWDFKWRRIA